MASLYVPSRFRSAFIQIANVSEEAVDELCALLERNPEILTSRESAHEAAGQLKSLSGEDGRAIVDAVIPLMFYKASSGESTEAVVADTIRTLKRGDKDEARISTDLVPKLEQRLSRLLALSGVALKAKAMALATDCPRLYTEAKVISDIRPVFGAEVSNPPLAAAIVHSLRISFSEGGTEKEFFVQLDAGDLKDLQQLIDRAVTKDVTLRGFLQQRSNLQVFDTSLPHE